MATRSILLVDDNREILEALGSLLTQEGYSVDYAFDGEEALEKIARSETDLVIMDIFMPGMGGLDLADALKQNPEFRKIPILAMSAFWEYESGAPRKDLRADDFIRKPPAKRELLRKVETLLSRTTSPPRAEEPTVPLPQERGRREVPARAPVDERIYRLIAETTLDWAMWIDRSEQVLFCSPSSQRITGYAPSEFTADANLWHAIVHPADQGLWRAHRAAVRGGGSTEAVKFRIVRKDGATRWIAHVCQPVHDEGGHFLGTFSSNRDATDAKAVEARVMRVQRLEAVSALASGIAHDLNNVLTPILLGIEVLRDRVADEAGRRALANIEASAQRGAEVLQQFIGLTGSAPGERAELRLGRIISEIGKMIQEMFPRDIHFSATVPPDLWIVSGNAVQLSQVLMTLCLNARNVMPQGGPLGIRAENSVIVERAGAPERGPKPGSYAVLKVVHGGTGIPADVIERLRAHPVGAEDTANRDVWSLATSLRVIEQHGGHLDVTCGPRGCSGFVLHLPAAAPEQPAPPPPPAGQAALAPAGNGELVLLVDDEGVIREAMQALLEGTNYRVLPAGNGAEALLIYAERWREIALVVSDMMMPLLDGSCTVDGLRRINPDVKVLLISGLPSPEATAGASRIGAPFLQKPYSADRLLRKVHEVLRG